MPTLVRSYLSAVCRAFTRQQPTCVAHTVSEWKLQLLAQYGYEPEDSQFGGGYLEPAAAAEAIAGHMARDLEVELGDALAALSDDLVWRAGWCDAMVEDLESDGLTPDRLSAGLHWTGFWNRHGADAELVRLSI